MINVEIGLVDMVSIMNEEIWIANSLYEYSSCIKYCENMCSICEGTYNDQLRILENHEAINIDCLKI